jgi:hypothetical protein
VQQEGARSSGDRPVERQEQRDGQILGEFRAAVGRERCRVDNWLWQPGTDVLLGRRAPRSACRDRIRVVVVMRNARESDTLSRSAACQRKYVSCTASRRQPSIRACGRRDRAAADGMARSSRRDSTRGVHACTTASGDAAGAAQSEPDRGPCRSVPQSSRRSLQPSPLPVPRPPSAAVHDQPTDDQADRAQHQGHDGPASPVAGAVTTGGAGQSHPPMTAPISPTTAAAEAPSARGQGRDTDVRGLGPRRSDAAAGAASPPPTTTAAARAGLVARCTII